MKNEIDNTFSIYLLYIILFLSPLFVSRGFQYIIDIVIVAIRKTLASWRRFRRSFLETASFPCTRVPWAAPSPHAVPNDKVNTVSSSRISFVLNLYPPSIAHLIFDSRWSPWQSQSKEYDILAKPSLACRTVLSFVTPGSIPSQGRQLIQIPYTKRRSPNLKLGYVYCASIPLLTSRTSRHSLTMSSTAWLYYSNVSLPTHEAATILRSPCAIVNCFGNNAIEGSHGPCAYSYSWKKNHLTEFK